jgi:hypothetical protein
MHCWSAQVRQQQQQQQQQYSCKHTAVAAQCSGHLAPFPRLQSSMRTHALRSPTNAHLPLQQPHQRSPPTAAAPPTLASHCSSPTNTHLPLQQPHQRSPPIAAAPPTLTSHCSSTTNAHLPLQQHHQRSLPTAAAPPASVYDTTAGVAKQVPHTMLHHNPSCSTPSLSPTPAGLPA